MLQLCSFINLRASQSNSSGWEGGSDCDPISSKEATMPRPKICCHTLLTRVRAVRGFSLLTIHLESPSLFFGQASFQGFRLWGVAGPTVSVFISQLPLSKTWVVLFRYSGFSMMMGSVGVSVFNSCIKRSSIWEYPELIPAFISGRNANHEI